jgi:hypothetical protein
MNLKGSKLEHSDSTNTLIEGNLKYDYDTIGTSTKLSFNKPIPLALLVEYVYNYKYL